MSMPLSNCIKTYIDSQYIKTLAEKAAWIGNDETHYVRKHDDRNVGDLKKFIAAAIHFISMMIIYEDAETITPA